MTRARDLADSADKDISGTFTVDDLTASGDVSVGGNLSVSGTTTTIDSANAQTVDLGDNDKIRLGDGDDLQIYHDGTHSYISDVGDGPLRITTDGTGILLNKSTTESMGRFLTDGAVELYYDNAKKFETTSSGVEVTGNVGVGVSPTETLHLKDQTAIIKLESSDASLTSNQVLGGLQWRSNDPSGIGVADVGQIMLRSDSSVGGSYYMQFNVSSSSSANFEASRIDSTGTTLIGKDSNTVTVAGSAFGANGVSNHAADSAAALNVGRLTNSGDMLRFYSGSTLVGGIGNDGNVLYIGSHEGTDAFLGFGNSIVRPVTLTGAARDNAIDLGYDGMRFKDLWLSGGVYLGGTGSANKLEDYEEGTWNVTDGSGAGLSFSVISNVYTKVGRLVVATANVLWPSTSNTSLARLALPFTADPNGSATGGVVTEDNYSSSQVLTAAINYSNGVIFRTDGVNALSNANLSGKRVRFTVTYHHG